MAEVYVSHPRDWPADALAAIDQALRDRGWTPVFPMAEGEVRMYETRPWDRPVAWTLLVAKVVDGRRVIGRGSYGDLMRAQQAGRRVYLDVDQREIVAAVAVLDGGRDWRAYAEPIGLRSEEAA